MVSISCRHLKPPPNFGRDRYSQMFNKFRSLSDVNNCVETVKFSSQVAEHMVVVKEYGRTQDATVYTKHPGGLLPENRPGMHSYLRSYTVDSDGSLTQASPFI